jgi:hypothetical protein
VKQDIARCFVLLGLFVVAGALWFGLAVGIAKLFGGAK